MPDSGAGSRPIIERRVTASLDEFEHGLRAAFPHAVQGGPDEFRATYCGTVMEVRLTPLPPRAIGCLALPVLAVTIRFPAASDDERVAMLARLDLATHRGGG